MALLRRNSLISTPSLITSKRLIPYKSSGLGSCQISTNCLSCTTDSKCAWCPEKQTCFDKSDQDFSCSSLARLWPEQCSNCSHHIHCSDCLRNNKDGACEWLTNEGRCVRQGRFPLAVQEVSQCPMDCPERSTCTDCIGQSGHCVWCQELGQCFQFSTYAADYSYGQCKTWIDKDVEEGSSRGSRDQCKTCQSRPNCSTCLQV